MNNSKEKINFVSWYCSYLEKNFNKVILVALVVSLISVFYSIKLYQNLRTDLEELLPSSAQSVRDLKVATQRIGGLNHLSIIIESDSEQAGHQFLLDLTEQLKKLPSSLVERVENNVISTQEFFKKNKAMYMDVEDWRSLEDYIRARLRYERSQKSPFSLGLEDKKNTPPEFNFDALKEKYEKKYSSNFQFPNGYFESKDKKTHIVLAYLPGKISGMASNQNLSNIAHEIVEKLKPKSYAEDMQVGFSGDVQNVVEEHDAVVEDLIKSSVIVSLLVWLSMILFFKTIQGTLALCVALFAGTVWTFGLSYLFIGYLNANTAFLGSIVIGNGINFGIIFLARYVEERRKAVDVQQCLSHSLRYTWSATSTAALAAGLSYLSLTLTQFRGFNQFGVIGAIGMLLCWVSAFTLLPALLLWLEKKNLLKFQSRAIENVFFQYFSNFITKYFKSFVFLSSVCTVFALIFLMKLLTPNIIESDFTKLRNKHSIVSGSGFWSKKVDAVFQRYLTPTAILTQSAEDTNRITEQLRQMKKESGESFPIADIVRVQDFLPTHQKEKTLIIRRIQRLLTPKILSQLSKKDRDLVEEYLPKDELGLIKIDDLPNAIVVHFRELDGSLGKIIHVYPRLNTEKFWDAREVIQFTEKARQAVQKVGAVAAVAGQPPLSADMIQAVTQDGPRATFFAFLAVFILAVVVFRRGIDVLWVLSALLLGVLWMAGVMGVMNYKINFLNFIALPITFGIGIDYAVNIFSRYRADSKSHKKASIQGVIQNTGGAVALCSATTIIGYSSLLIASNQAFVSFGLLAVLGEITCLAAALVTIPSLWVWLEKRRQ